MAARPSPTVCVAPRGFASLHPCIYTRVFTGAQSVTPAREAVMAEAVKHVLSAGVMLRGSYRIERVLGASGSRGAA